MRISDWSSDVCSSDLTGGYRSRRAAGRGVAGALSAVAEDAVRVPALGSGVVFGAAGAVADGCLAARRRALRHPRRQFLAGRPAGPGDVCRRRLTGASVARGGFVTASGMERVVQYEYVPVVSAFLK